MSLCLCLPLSAVVYPLLPAHFTINNDISMRIAPNQADRMLRLKVVIGNDCTGSCKFNYHTTTTAQVQLR